MRPVRPLPEIMAHRYRGWRATGFADNAALHRRLAEEGQAPRAMVVGCCDSRVAITAMLAAEPGEIFLHRNIAALVPPYETGGGRHGTSAALEYAVTVLAVPHLIVAGHSRCGGVKGCHDMCAGRAPALEAPDSFVGRWMDVLRPAYGQVADIPDEAARLTAFEKRAVVVSLDNLMTFPFVADAVAEGRLSLHGLWTDIADGALEAYDADADAFVPV